jgi:hypothetical protein
MAASCFVSGGVGFGGTLARLGYGWLAPGGGGRCWAIAPPCRLCHQLTGFSEDWEEQPVRASGVLHSSIHAAA